MKVPENRAADDQPAAIVRSVPRNHAVKVHRAARFHPQVAGAGAVEVKVTARRNHDIARDHSVKGEFVDDSVRSFNLVLNGTHAEKRLPGHCANV
jgi:predicted secreted protein